MRVWEREHQEHGSATVRSHQPQTKCASASERTPGGTGGRPPENNKDPAKADRAHQATPQVRERKRAHTGGHGGSPPRKERGPGEADGVRRAGPSRVFPVELWGFEPQTSSMPWRRATNCAIAPCGSPKGDASTLPDRGEWLERVRRGGRLPYTG